jgi:transcriptional regulator with XRE-family HTH domain
MNYKGEIAMEYDEDVQITGTTGDYIGQRLRDEKYGQEYTLGYLKADFLATAANALFTLRREAGLTQAQVAEQLQTKQSAIARLEADFDGAMSLRRFVDFALACGVIPHHVTFTPIETARNFTIAQPEMPLTFENELNWCSANFRLTLEPCNTTSPGTFTLPSSTTTLREAGTKLSIIETQSQSLRTQERRAA